MRIGAVKFLNAYPLCWGLKYAAGVTIEKDIPSRLADDLYRHELDLAIISSIEFHRHRDIFNYYPDLCISAKSSVESIRLYLSPTLDLTTRQAIEPATTWLKSRRMLRIYYDIATRSSLSLLKVLLNEFNHEACINNGLEFIQVAPPFDKLMHDLSEQEVLLLIGDSALQLKDFPSIDMGELYFKTFRRAFVYAIWVYRSDTGGQARDILLNAYDIGQKNLDTMIKDAVEEFGFSEEFTRDYLTRIVQYNFTDELKNDMNFFFEKFDQLEF